MHELPQQSCLGLSKQQYESYTDNDSRLFFCLDCNIDDLPASPLPNNDMSSLTTMALTTGNQEDSTQQVAPASTSISPNAGNVPVLTSSQTPMVLPRLEHHYYLKMPTGRIIEALHRNRQHPAAYR